MPYRVGQFQGLLHPASDIPPLGPEGLRLGASAAILTGLTGKFAGQDSRRRARCGSAAPVDHPSALESVGGTPDSDLVDEFLEGGASPSAKTSHISRFLAPSVNCRLPLSAIAARRQPVPRPAAGTSCLPADQRVSGHDGGPVKTEHVFQPTQEAWDEVVRIRTEYERLRDGDTDADTSADSL